MSETKIRTWQPTKDGGYTYVTTIVAQGHSIAERRPLHITAYDGTIVEGNTVIVESTIARSWISGEDEQR